MAGDREPHGTEGVDPISLRGILLFQGLMQEQLKVVAKQLHPMTVRAQRDLMTMEQPGEVVYIILSGTLKVHTEQASGRDVVLALIGPGQTVGEMSIIENTGRSASVLALEDTRLLWIDRVAFLQCLNTIPLMSMNLLRILSQRLRLANAQIASLATQDVYDRVSRQLVALADEYGRAEVDGSIHIPLSLTQSDLADIVGASRVRVNQVLVEYRQKGTIATDSLHHVTIHDMPALRRRVLQ